VTALTMASLVARLRSSEGQHYSLATAIQALLTVGTTSFNTLQLCILPYGLYLCVPYGSHSKQRLFTQTALTGWAL
jgi:hypothetical protein